MFTFHLNAETNEELIVQIIEAAKKVQTSYVPYDSKPERKARAKKADKVDPAQTDIEDFIPKITAESVKKLAQEKIASGAIDRLKVKYHVLELGGTQISDLDDKALLKLNDLLIAV